MFFWFLIFACVMATAIVLNSMIVLAIFALPLIIWHLYLAVKETS